MVIDELKITLDKVKSDGLYFALFLAIISMLYFGMVRKSSMDAIVYIVFIEFWSTLAYISIKSSRVLRDVTPEIQKAIDTTTGIAFSKLRLTVHLGLILATALLCATVNGGFNSGNIFLCVAPIFVNIVLIIFVCSAGRPVSSLNSLDPMMPNSSDWPKSVDFNNPMNMANNWHSDGAHPLSFTNPQSPNFPGYNDRHGY